ncbi:MAG TPA: hypothetical protein DCO82_10185 [Alphaproteobacteria bacterium]|nr:hypothetical protein [Alphaproteobacteria bacterium]
MRRKRLPKYVSEFSDRHGKPRIRFRKKGHKDYYFTGAPLSDRFWQEYQACLDAKPIGNIGAERTAQGSISSLIAAYYQSPEFAGLNAATKATYRGIIERFREEHGDKRLALLERRHIKAIIAARAATPSAANNLLRMIRMLMRFAIDIGMRKDDPTYAMRGIRTKAGGFHSWTEEEIAQFEAVHPIGSKARLAFSLMLFTASRRSDAIRMGWQHVKGGRMAIRQQKTDVRIDVPIHQCLQVILDGAPKSDLTFLLTAHGKPFSPAGFGNWFRAQCDAAGLPQCSAHGLRKAAARRLAEAGCTDREIMSITGHKTTKEVTRYTNAADQVTLSDQAMGKVGGTKTE